MVKRECEIRIEKINRSKSCVRYKSLLTEKVPEYLTKIVKVKIRVE